MVEKMLPLLSDGLRRIVENIREKHPTCDIAKELLLADDLINDYNRISSSFLTYSDKPIPVMVVAQEAINKILNDEARMLSFRHNAFEISYLPKGREAIYTDSGNWGRENRQTAKPARIIQKILNREFKCKEFEDFSNWIKNEMLVAGEFVVVSGSDITKYYNEENYVEIKGTLGNSCMRHPECSEFFKLYEDEAKLLICRKDDKILGRAIVWELPEGTFMDRIYTCYDYLESQFIDYAQNHNWHHRKSNSLLNDGDYQYWLGPEDNYSRSRTWDLVIQLNDSYTYMPYVDSFRYYNSEHNFISTNPSRGNQYLSNTDGSYFESTNSFTCECCGRVGVGYDDEIPEEWVYSSWEDAYYCEDCAKYCEGIDDYISVNTETVLVINRYGEEILYPELYVKNYPRFCYINNTWYDINYGRVKYDETTNSYILKDE